MDIPGAAPDPRQCFFVKREPGPNYSTWLAN
jgi:hypothetical protein